MFEVKTIHSVKHRPCARNWIPVGTISVYQLHPSLSFFYHHSAKDFSADIGKNRRTR